MTMSGPNLTPGEVSIASQELEENIEDLRRRVDRGIRARTFWDHLLVWDIFRTHREKVLPYPDVYKPVADAYRDLRELNEVVPVARLGNPIPENEIPDLQERVNRMANASERLRELTKRLTSTADSSASPAAASTKRASHEDHPTAFISWAHGDEVWQETILKLAVRLRAMGIAADVDLFHLHDPAINWATYGVTKVNESDFVLIAVNGSYKERWEGTGDPRKGAGAAREANALKAMFDDDRDEFQRKVKIVVLPGAFESDIPTELASAGQRFTLSDVTQQALEDLLRTLTDQPAFPPPPVGQVPILPAQLIAPSEDADEPVGTDQLRRRLEELESTISRLTDTSTEEQERLATEHRTVEAAIQALPERSSQSGVSADSASRPAIFGSTSALLRHLQRDGAQTERQLEGALGDVDQIGPGDISEWADWAAANGTIERTPGSKALPRWNITDNGQRVLGPPSPLPKSVSTALDPVLLQGRIYPYMYMSAMDSTEKAFCVRSVAALRVPEDNEPLLATEDEHRFLELIRASALETWIVTATSTGRPASSGPAWRSVYPTTSTVVTLRRPPVALAFGGWTAEGRAGYNVRPYGSTGARGMAWINVDVVVRPEGEPTPNRWPFGPEDLFSVICAELSSLLDGGLARSALAGISRPSLLAIATVVVATGARLGDFVLMMRPSWHQAEGALEAPGGEWPLRDHADVADPARREATVRRWIKTLLRDSGISGHEGDIDRFAVH
jgi:hypothetical protein